MKSSVYLTLGELTLMLFVNAIVVVFSVPFFFNCFVTPNTVFFARSFYSQVEWTNERMEEAALVEQNAIWPKFFRPICLDDTVDLTNARVGWYTSHHVTPYNIVYTGTRAPPHIVDYERESENENERKHAYCALYMYVLYDVDIYKMYVSMVLYGWWMIR